MPHKSVYAGLIFFAMLYRPLDFFIGIFMQMLSRKNETEADRFAVETTADSQSMVDALKKLSSHNLSNLFPHPLYVFLNYSHPPVLQRIRALQR
jgi:STE24 endopeptidase